MTTLTDADREYEVLRFLDAAAARGAIANETRVRIATALLACSTCDGRGARNGGDLCPECDG